MGKQPSTQWQALMVAWTRVETPPGTEEGAREAWKTWRAAVKAWREAVGEPREAEVEWKAR
jgi:hypothetical protein